VNPIDALDARILLALDDDPEASTVALARILAVSRNTVHARLQRLTRDHLLAPSRRIPPSALDHPLVAFVSLTIAQSFEGDTASRLRELPEVVEIHSTTGEADLLVKVVARDTTDLHRITIRMLAIEGIVRSSTVISLREEMPYRTRALLEVLAEDGSPSPAARATT